MTNEEKAVNILKQLEQHTTFIDIDNYREKTKTIIRLLDLADEGNYSEARAEARKVESTIQETVLREINEIEKGGKK